MSKLLIGLAAIPVIAVGGYFGTEAYLKHRIASEIEANFAQIRNQGGQAKRGDLTFDLWTRTVTISDIATEFTARRPASIKVGSFKAKGVGLSSGAIFTAHSITIADVDASGPIALPPDTNVSFKAPKVEIADYSGPTQLQGKFVASSSIDMYRFVLEQLATVKARSVTAPSVAMVMSGNTPSANGTYTYTDLALRDIQGGKIASTTIAKVNIARTLVTAGKATDFKGEIRDVTTSDFDTAATAALLDPAKANDTTFYRLQRQASSGPYTITFDAGPTLRIDGMRIGEIRAQPSKFKAVELAALLPQADTLAANPRAHAGRIKDMMEAVASLYEGIQIDEAALLGFGVEMPDGNIMLAAMRFNLDRGKIGEFSVEGLDAKMPSGPLKVGRFAVKGFDLAGLTRQTMAFAATNAPPSIDQSLALLSKVDGFEAKDIVTPHKETNKLLNIANLSMTWGQFVGPIPSKAHLALTMTGPIEDSDGEPFALLRSAGFNEATVTMDVGLAWNESDRKLTLEPGMMAIEKLFAFTAATTLGNVNRTAFSTNPQQAIMASALVEAGPLKMTLRDLGGLDLLIRQYAGKKGIPLEEARRLLVEDIKVHGQLMSVANPATSGVASAIAAFIEKPRSTVTLSVAPKQTMALMQMIEVLKDSGPAGLSLLQIEAQTGP